MTNIMNTPLYVLATAMSASASTLTGAELIRLQGSTDNKRLDSFTVGQLIAEYNNLQQQVIQECREICTLYNDLTSLQQDAASAFAQVSFPSAESSLFSCCKHLGNNAHHLHTAYRIQFLLLTLLKLLVRKAERMVFIANDDPFIDVLFSMLCYLAYRDTHLKFGNGQHQLPASTLQYLTAINNRADEKDANLCCKCVLV